MNPDPVIFENVDADTDPGQKVVPTVFAPRSSKNELELIFK